MENKIVVIYKSKYGATKRYAGWIAIKLNADLYELSDISKSELKNYDTIIYGGPLYFEKIKGIKFIVNNYDEIKNKNITIFTVGLRDFDEEYMQSILKNNLPKEIINNIELFYFRGKIDYKELSIKDKIFISELKSSIYNDDLTSKRIDYMDKKSVDILLTSKIL